MTSEQVAIASRLTERIGELDKEIYDLMDVLPPTDRSKTCGRRGGQFVHFFIGNILRLNRYCHEDSSYNGEKTIHMTNEDVHALIALRQTEIDALRQTIDEIKSN